MIKNEKTFVTLGETMTTNVGYGKTQTVKKGRTFNYDDFRAGGIEVGLMFIPIEKFTKFTLAWDEVTKTTDGNGVTTIVKVHNKRDVTNDYVGARIAKERREEKALNNANRIALKREIAELRKMIAEVKTGRAEAKLVEMTEKLTNWK